MTRTMWKVGGMALLSAGVIWLGCISSNLTISADGQFRGTYASVEADYSGPIFFNYVSDEGVLEVDGKMTIEGQVVEFSGAGELSSSPASLYFDALGSELSLHFEGELSGGHLTGTYQFTSTQWGSDNGTVDMSFF